jgi:ATP-binding cassette, subfamily C (CFTR/MRP), member 1
MAMSQAGLIASGSYYMVAALPLLLLGIFILQKVYLRTSRQLQFLDLEARSPIYSHFLETLDGLVTLRAFGWQEPYKGTNIKHVDYSQRPYYLLYCIQRWLNLVLDLIVAAMGILVVALALNLSKSSSAGLLGIALNNVLGKSLLSNCREWYLTLFSSVYY